jgi:hypothetical protein
MCLRKNIFIGFQFIGRRRHAMFSMLNYKREREEQDVEREICETQGRIITLIL